MGMPINNTTLNTRSLERMYYNKLIKVKNLENKILCIKILKEKENESEELNKENEVLNNKVKELNKENEILNNENNELNNKVKELTNDNTTLNKENKILNKENEILNNKITN